MRFINKKLYAFLLVSILILISIHPASSLAFWEEKETSFVTTVYNDQILTPIIDESIAGNTVYMGSSESMYAEIKLKSEALEKDAFDITYHTTDKVSTHNKINISPDEDILISGLTGFYIKYANGTVWEFDESDLATSVNCAIKDYEGDLWLASSSTGVTKYSKGYFYNNNKASGLDNISLNTITKAGDKYYIGSDEKLYICDLNWNQLDTELTEALDGIRIRHAITDTDDKVRTIFQCADGNIAAGTQSGISFIGNGKVLDNYGYEQGLTTPSILCFTQTADGTLYAGSDGGGIYAIKENSITNYGFDQGLEEGVVLRIIENTEDPGFFVSAGSSLYYWSDASRVTITFSTLSFSGTSTLKMSYMLEGFDTHKTVLDHAN